MAWERLARGLCPSALPLACSYSLDSWLRSHLNSQELCAHGHPDPFVPEGSSVLRLILALNPLHPNIPLHPNSEGHGGGHSGALKDQWTPLEKGRVSQVSSGWEGERLEDGVENRRVW